MLELHLRTCRDRQSARAAVPSTAQLDALGTPPRLVCETCGFSHSWNATHECYSCTTFVRRFERKAMKNAMGADEQASAADLRRQFYGAHDE